MSLAVKSSCHPLLTVMSAEIHSELLLHLPPRQIYKLMCTSRGFHQICRTNRAYWERLAFHLLRRSLSDTPASLYFVKGGYKRAMDAFLLAHDVPLSQGIKDTVNECLAELQDPDNLCGNTAVIYNEIMMPAVDDPRRLARLIVEDAVETRYTAEAMIRSQPTSGIIVRPAATGFVIARRRATRSSARLIHSLDDEPTLDLACKRRIMEYLRHFVRDMTDRRVKTMILPNHDVIVTELEEDTCLTHVPFYYSSP
jgi:hypothetical protein